MPSKKSFPQIKENLFDRSRNMENNMVNVDAHVLTADPSPTRFEIALNQSTLAKQLQTV